MNVLRHPVTGLPVFRCWIRLLGPCFLIGSLLLLGLLIASPLRAQMIVGEVRLQGSNEPAQGVDVGLVDRTGRLLSQAQSDSAGAFVLSVPSPGRYRIIASRLGLTTSSSQVEVGEKEIIEVELNVAEEPIAIDPLVVVARRRVQRGTLDEFYERMERMKRKGLGTFLTREDIEKYDRTNTVLMLQTIPGVMAQPTGGVDYRLQMRGRRGICSPAIYVDGQLVSAVPTGSRASQGEESSTQGLYLWGDGGGGAARPRYASILTMDLEGVEVYRYYEHVDDYWSSDCGAIFLWRKRDWGRPFDTATLLWVGGVASVLSLVFFVL